MNKKQMIARGPNKNDMPRQGVQAIAIVGDDLLIGSGAGELMVLNKYSFEPKLMQTVLGGVTSIAMDSMRCYASRSNRPFASEHTGKARSARRLGLSAMQSSAHTTSSLGAASSIGTLSTTSYSLVPNVHLVQGVFLCRHGSF